MSKWKQGKFKIINECKYKGKTIPSYKSSLEQRVMSYLDTNSNVLHWAYEEVIIPYNKPLFDQNGKISHSEIRKYYMDFVADIINDCGKVETCLIEVKSLSETNPPIAPKKRTQKAMRAYKIACETFLVNRSKWAETEKYCASRGWKFILLTSDKIY